MITSFAVGSVFKIVDEASPALRKILKSVTQLDAAAESARRNLTGFARTRLQGVNNQFAALTKEVGGFDRGLAAAIGGIGKLAKSVASLAETGTAIASTGGAVQVLAEDWHRVAVSATEATTAMRAAGRVKSPSFAALTTGTDAALSQATLLANVWRTIAAQVTKAAAGARMMGVARVPAITGPGGVPGGGLPGLPRHGPRSGFYVSGLSTAIPGGHAHFRGGGNAAMAAAGALAYGVYEEAELEDAVFQMKWHAGLPNTAENSKYFRDLIQSTASKTGFNYKEIAEAATDEIRLLKGAEGKESGGLAILPEMLRAAALEAKVKPGTSLKGAMTSLVEMAHMAQEYGAEDIKGFAPLLAFLSTTNPATMPQMVRAASYAMPTLHANLAMDPADILYETTAIARAGATNTKSGTWVRAAFERALPPNPNITGEKEYERRMYAMEKVGLVDAKGKSTVLDATGTHIDIDKLLNLVQEKTNTMSIVDKNAFMKKAFGEQGGRGIALMMSPAVMAQTAELKKEFPEFKGRYETFFEDYSKESPVQKARETWEDLKNVLSDIGAIALPPLMVGLRGLDELLKTITGNFPKQGEKFGPPAKGTLGEALGKGMTEGAIAAAPIAGIMALTGAVVPAALLEAIGAVIGGTYEGGKFLLGGMPFGISSAHADELAAPPRSATKTWGDVLLDQARTAFPDPATAIGKQSLLEFPAFADAAGKLASSLQTSPNASKELVGLTTAAQELPVPLAAASDAIRNLASAASFVSSTTPGRNERNDRWDVIPPARQRDIVVHTALNVDGRRMAETVTKHQVHGMSGSVEGSPYFDGTHGVVPLDFVAA